MRIPTRIWATTGFVAAAAMLAAGGVLVAAASSASADIISSGGVLTLDSTPGTLANGTMAPGDTEYWPISANLDASTAGELTLKVISSEPLATDPDGLRLTLAQCGHPWVMQTPPAAPTCDDNESTIIPDTAFADISSTRIWNLGQLGAVSQLPMMATISLPENVPADLQGTNAAIRFGFTALGDTENASPSDPKTPVLGFTGVDPTGPALLGIGLLLAGITLGRLRVLAQRASSKVAS